MIYIDLKQAKRKRPNWLQQFGLSGFHSGGRITPATGETYLNLPENRTSARINKRNFHPFYHF
jgi:hypothetical protein